MSVGTRSRDYFAFISMYVGHEQILQYNKKSMELLIKRATSDDNLQSGGTVHSTGDRRF
jgi:hypothetical protein